MKLYNTLNKQIEDISPLNAPEVGVYTCGPTVYDYQHVGNWFTYIRYDLLVRTLKSSGFEPKWVLNITDVGHLTSDADEGEDKLEKGARREGKTAWEVAEFYTDDFMQGLKALNITQPDHLPKATEHIEEQIELVKKLEALGYTYSIDDGVYYDTSKFPTYADFAQLDLDEMQAGKRVSFNPQKHNASDFALWKFSPKGHKRDMEWDSPWGRGFPGWHLECSAMAMKYLGDTIDIHCGGIDHLPVHHTNEIAQSQAVTGKPLAKYWMHTNHILFNDAKMAKSLGNVVTLQDIKAKGYDLESLRLLVLQSHYRTQSLFSWEQLQSAKHSLDSIRNGFTWVQWTAKDNESPLDSLDEFFKDYTGKIKNYLSDDLSTPQALALLHECATKFGAKQASQLDLPCVREFADFINDYLGLSILTEPLNASQKDMIKDREKARESHNWSKSDEIRDLLRKDGIELSDSENGPRWSRV